MKAECPICASESVIVAQLTTITLLKCSQCHWLFTQGAPVKHFDKSNLSSEKKDEYLAITQKSVMYSNHEPGDKVLDINSGDGTLLGWYLKNTVTVGVEPNPQLMKLALNNENKPVDVPIPEKFSYDKIKMPSFGSPVFKIITVVDVLQDFPKEDILPLLMDCRRLLSDTGVLVIQAPYFAQLIKDKPEDFPFHQTYFLVFTLRNAIIKAGMEIEGVEFPKRGIRVYVTKLSNKKFATNDFQEKLRLLTTMSTAIIQELHQRFDIEVPYKVLEERINTKPLERRA